MDQASGHMVFDVKMDFTRKARWALDRQRCVVPGSAHSGVVSRDSVRVGLVYANVNVPEVCVATMRNAHLQAPSSQKGMHHMWP